MPLSPAKAAKATAAGNRVRDFGNAALDASSKLGDSGEFGSLTDRLEGLGIAAVGLGEGIGALALGSTIAVGDVPGAIAAGVMLVDAYGRINTGIDRLFAGEAPDNDFGSPPNFAAGNAAAAAAAATNSAGINNAANQGGDLSELVFEVQRANVGIAATNITLNVITDPAQVGNAAGMVTLYAIKSVTDEANFNAQLAMALSQQVFDKVAAAILALAHYPLSAEGVASFLADKAAGLVTGSGLIVLRDGNPAINPELLTVISPSGDTGFPTLEVILGALNGLPIYTR